MRNEEVVLLGFLNYLACKLSENQRIFVKKDGLGYKAMHIVFDKVSENSIYFYTQEDYEDALAPIFGLNQKYREFTEFVEFYCVKEYRAFCMPILQIADEYNKQNGMRLRFFVVII